jgi:hypothetical protein
MSLHHSEASPHVVVPKTEQLSRVFSLPWWNFLWWTWYIRSAVTGTPSLFGARAIASPWSALVELAVGGHEHMAVTHPSLYDNEYLQLQGAILVKASAAVWMYKACSPNDPCGPNADYTGNVTMAPCDDAGGFNAHTGYATTAPCDDGRRHWLTWVHVVLLTVRTFRSVGCSVPENGNFRQGPCASGTRRCFQDTRTRDISHLPIF